MATPEKPEEFEAFPLEEQGRPYGTVYVAREIWQARDLQQQELIFYLQDYGRFRLKIHG